MEDTADRIRSVVKNLLPERPHHLSLYPDRKYPVPPNYWQHQSPLQYSTFISDADRGVLLTRPYFDICDEPEPSPATPQPNVRTGPKKALNKMSFKDYKKQKERACASPTENGVPGKQEEKNHTSAAVKPEKESLRKEQDKPRDAGSQRDSKAQEARANGDIERSKSLTAKPIPRDAPSPSESKKRPLELEDRDRPSKKPRANEELPRKPPRAETPRSREQNLASDKTSGKDGRALASQSTPSSRAALGIPKERDRAVSPKIVVNGAKTQSNSVPKRSDTSGKPFVPPLLSPLRHPAIDDELDTKSPKKRPKEGPLGSKTLTKASKQEVMVKKQKSSVPDLPSLLSPTLPAMVEDELERLEQVLAKGESSQSSEGSKSARKTQVRENVEAEGRPKSRIVTLKIKKSLRPRVKGLLALPSKNSKERSASMENTPPPAKKRPRHTESSIEATSAIPVKRTKVPEPLASKAPYTPPNPPGPALQAPSGSSQGQTPRDRVPPTPSAGDVPPPSRSGLSKDHLQRRQMQMMSLGKKLKRERDQEKHEREKERHKPPNGGGANGDRLTADDLRPAMLTMEMILAYFIAFRSGSQACELSRTHVDEKAWLTLEAHLRELRGMTYRSLPLYTLATQLNGILINEILRVFAIQGASSRESKMDEASSGHLLRNLTSQFAIWSEADKLRGKLTDERLKTPVMGPWTSVYKAAADTLVMMGRIAEREHVNWRADLAVPKDA